MTDEEVQSMLDASAGRLMHAVQEFVGEARVAYQEVARRARADALEEAADLVDERLQDERPVGLGDRIRALADGEPDGEKQ